MTRALSQVRPIPRRAAVSGYKSLGEVERYTAAADQRKLSSAAIAKLTDTQSEGEP